MARNLAVFVDLDGVLVDFVRGALSAHGVKMKMDTVEWNFDKQLGIDPATFWDRFDRPFWAGLDPLDDGMEFLRNVESLAGEDRVFLLSSPCKTDGCWEGKADWVRKHLPRYARKLFIGAAKHAFAGPNKWLIDDRNENVDSWREHGGEGFLVPRPWNRFKKYSGPTGAFDTKALVTRLEHML